MFTYGTFISAAIAFLMVALVLFIIVKVAIRVMGPKAEKTSCAQCVEDDHPDVDLDSVIGGAVHEVGPLPGVSQVLAGERVYAIAGVV